MRHRTTLIPLILSLLAARPASAQLSEAGRITYTAPNPTALRAQLLDHALAVAAKDPVEAATALNCRGMSFERDGQPDSAVACYERAFELDPSRRIPLADARLHRMAPGDAARAIAVLRPIQPKDPQIPPQDSFEAQALFAWAHYLAGRPDSAQILMAPVERRLTHGTPRTFLVGGNRLSTPSEWRYRLACVALDLKDYKGAMTWLMPLAVASRGFDPDVMDMMKAAAKGLGTDASLTIQIRQELKPSDEDEDAVVGEFGARKVLFGGADGFPLGGVLLAGPPRARAAVVLMNLDDPLDSYDSLAAGLRGMGFSTMLMYARGSGRSVAPSCPLPETWRGRETMMQSLCAGDVRQAVAALAREAGADTSRYLLIGLGPTTPIAVEAAGLDPRAKVLMLVSPTTSPVDRGTTRARLAELRRPVYFQLGPEDFYPSGELTDSLYQACDMRASRIADSEREGSRATLFRADPRIIARFKQWLDESWAPAAAPPATRPSRPRRG